MMQRPKTADVVAALLALGVLAALWGALVWAPSDTARWLLGGGAVTGAAALAMWGLLGPAARRLSGERTELTAAERSTLSPAERVEAVNHARSALMQSVTGLVVIVGVVFTAAGLLYTARTLDTTRQGQVTDRYTKAVEQLGSSKREVRTGAIYALERIAADSPRDRLTIRDVLAAFVREHDPGPSTKTSKLPREPDTDVDAALIVLARRTADPPSSAELDLHNVRVPNARFPKESDDLGRVIGANLGGADLTRADLTRASLYNARLPGANLYAAKLRGATLDLADLGGAELRDADLFGAHLIGAYLRSANLNGADLRGAILNDADLRGADLRGAILNDADLRGADLRGSEGVSAEQVRKVAKTDATTRF
ncbi:pentapeptide repeat-containing protein [Actinomadura litoris]|uniref:Pentapeptide repeat-containing protein n=1 Tax=Actinomadura litoris TaxID=2678616 RepID=A0A7K1LB73_9ACTN|nr:pentapeptide repeat-containing protein [Actinomadura litoris]MUN41674.1 hypothetical protein [Actinomadura litoris]